MPISDYEHVEALRKRILIEIRETENRVKELKELADTLGQAPRMLRGTKFPTTGETPSKEPKSRQQRNKNFKALVLQYLEETPREPGTEIAVPKVVEFLRSKGVEGDYKSLYAYTHALLRKEAKKNEKVAYTKGRGYYRPESKPSEITQMVMGSLT